MDQSKKTMRHFYCRDVLWETFEQMANDFDCSIDYLINESMRYYARSKNYQGAQGLSDSGYPQPGGGYPAGTTMPPAQGAPRRAPAPPSGPPGRVPQSVPPRPPQPPGYVHSPPAAEYPAGPPPGYGRPPVPPPPSPQPRSLGVDPMGAPTLFLVFNNQRIPIDKDQFIIGRGSKTSDLAIKDGNISRKHAAVIRRNGTYYIKDLGSTNGIDYNGMRIDNKRIDEGDIFHICDYELRFTYR